MMEEVDSGTTFVKELRLLDNKAPVYMLSSVGDEFNMEADYASAGLAGLFQKPIAADRLISVITTALKDSAE